MLTEPDPPFDPTPLRTGADLRRLGIEPARAGWDRVRRGVWLPPGVWPDLSPDARYAALVYSTLLTCREPQGIVLAGYSAAAIWGLPSMERWPGRTQFLQSEGMAGGSRYLQPLHGPPVVPVVRRSVQVTPVARTIVDLARVGTLDTALAAADHALREGLCTRDELAAETRSMPPGTRGRGVAGLVVDLADGLSGSPGESLSRLQMFRANFPRPALQVSYSDDRGHIGDVDFDLGFLIGEFDGKLKYRVDPTATPEEAAEIVWREKKREDRLRRHKNVARWTWSIARPSGALARHLMSFGVRPEPRSTWIDLGARRRAG